MPADAPATLRAPQLGPDSGLPTGLPPARLLDLAALATYARDETERDALTVTAPFTAEAVVHLPAGTPDDIRHAFAQARAAQIAWSARPFHERTAVLKRVHDLVLERREEAMDLIQLESGKTRYDAFLEVGDVAVVARYYAFHGEGAVHRERRAGLIPGLTRVETSHLPVGVVGIIAPWNYPLTMAISDALPALAAGNAVVIKPAEQTPLTALWTRDLLLDAGLPPDLLHMVPGRGPMLGPALLDEADFVHFTGSTEVGRIVAQGAAERLIGCSLELGGKNPMLVLDDADVEEAAAGAVRACYSSAGQLCVSIERLYVQRPLFDDFLAAFVARVRAMRVGVGYRWEMDMGSLAGPEQLEKVTAHVEDALAKGATALVGGKARPDLGPFVFEPTVLVGVTPDMRVAQEETFGPVVAVAAFDTEDEGVAFANDSEYGLNAVIWTGDPARGRALGRRIRCGTVNVNDAYTATWGSTDAPMGGMGQSGLGRRHGREGIAKYTEAQTLAVQHVAPLAPLPGMALEAFARVTLTGLRLLRKLPGLR